MATLGSTALTYADWAKRMDDGIKVAQIIELLSQTNEILDDMLVVEGNLPTGHKTTVRTGLPQATWRLLNNGVPNAKSTTAQIVDTCGNLETYAVIDKDIADLNGNTAEFRLSEVKAFLEGMSQQVASTIIYGNQHTNPERFTGFAPRYSTGSPPRTPRPPTTSSTAVALALPTPPSGSCLGFRYLPCYLPEGQDHWPPASRHGRVAGPRRGGNTYQAYRDHFKWEIGLVLRDWRYALALRTSMSPS
jgi:hypothetical protein